jgi:hypothetical protein
LVFLSSPALFDCHLAWNFIVFMVFVIGGSILIHVVFACLRLDLGRNEILSLIRN